MRKTLLVGLVLLVSAKAALGQHLGELTANYSYMHYVPVDNLPTANLNGGGGSVVLSGSRRKCKDTPAKTSTLVFLRAAYGVRRGARELRKPTCSPGISGPKQKFASSVCSLFSRGWSAARIPISTNLTTGNNNQNNFRYQAGLVFEF